MREGMNVVRTKKKENSFFIIIKDFFGTEKSPLGDDIENIDDNVELLPELDKVLVKWETKGKELINREKKDELRKRCKVNPTINNGKVTKLQRKDDEKEIKENIKE